MNISERANTSKKCKSDNNNYVGMSASLYLEIST